MKMCIFNSDIAKPISLFNEPEIIFDEKKELSDVEYGSATFIKKLSKTIDRCGDITLSEYINKLKGCRIHMCPKCKGDGYKLEKYDAYPSNYPDSGWVNDWKYRKVTCDLCEGEGWTVKKFEERMKMVSDGFYEVE